MRTLALVNLWLAAHAAFARREQPVPAPPADAQAAEPAATSNTDDAAMAAEAARRAAAS